MLRRRLAAAVTPSCVSPWRVLCSWTLPPPVAPSAPAAEVFAARAGPSPALLLPLSLFDELLLMAVPKRKTTPSRKGIRSTGKHLRFAPFVSRCHVCQRVKMPHAHCPHCPGVRVEKEEE